MNWFKRKPNPETNPTQEIETVQHQLNDSTQTQEKGGQPMQQPATTNHQLLDAWEHLTSKILTLNKEHNEQYVRYEHAYLRLQKDVTSLLYQISLLPNVREGLQGKQMGLRQTFHAFKEAQPHLEPLIDEILETYDMLKTNNVVTETIPADFEQLSALYVATEQAYLSRLDAYKLLNDEYFEMSETCQQLSDRYQALQRSIDRAEKDNSELEAERTELLLQIEDAEKQLQALSVATTQISPEDAPETDLSDSEGNTLENIKECLDEAETASEAKLCADEEIIENEEIKENEDVSQDEEANSTQLTELSHDIEKLTNEVEELTTQRDELKNSIFLIEASLDTQKGNLQQIIRQQEDQRQVLAALKDEQRKETTKYSRKISALKKELAALEKAKEQLTKESTADTAPKDTTVTKPRSRATKQIKPEKQDAVEKKDTIEKE